MSEEKKETTEQDKIKEPVAETPSQLLKPTYFMHYPFDMSIEQPNNIFMQKNKEPLNKNRAYGQFDQLYSYMASQAIVWLIPSGETYMPNVEDFKDMTWVANVGIYLPHTKDQTIILSNYTSQPRQGEENVAEVFFKSLQYKTIKCPEKWEGEAELKWLHDNVYVGGYGMRSDIKAFEWFEKTFDMKVIKVKMTNEENYHLDCNVFPLTSQKTLVCVGNFTDKEIKEIEKETEIIEVPKDIYSMDTTNCVRLYNIVLCNCCINEHKKGTKDYDDELHKITFLERVCAQNGMDLQTFNLSEFAKSGAALSCSVMNANFSSYKIPLS